MLGPDRKENSIARSEAKVHISDCWGVLLPAKREAAIEEQVTVSPESEIQDLMKMVKKAKERFVYSPPDKREAAMEEQVIALSEAEMKDLKKVIGEMDERLTWFEEENARLRKMAMNYRMDWINEMRRVDLLVRYGPDAVCESQARWSSPSPDRSYNDDSATHYRFINGDILNEDLSTAFSTTFPRRRSLNVLDDDGDILDKDLSTAFSTTFPRRRSLNVLDDDGRILDHNDRVRVHPTVNNGLTARDAVVIRMTGVDVCSSFQ
ncbi:hypothetical protein PILCRDRAFT_8216 [Piloderma croceum F 1598]|uniref:Uncharacterized protein n=1 Tax=Piloderma croceum (strain F 1598) TaxID=765440 RepID=A0A0C3BX23_PILCF|nr:hypothetical protein PILCRDRAFT_8216 [Piloderma croceum F 1598]